MLQLSSNFIKQTKDSNSSKIFKITKIDFMSIIIRVFHNCELHHTPKNIVPCIKIRYSVKKFSRLMPSRQATSPFNILCCSSRVCTNVHLYNCTSLLTWQRILKGEALFNFWIFVNMKNLVRKV